MLHDVKFVTQPFFGRIYILYSREYFQTKEGVLYSYLQHVSPAEFDAAIKQKIACEWNQNEIDERTESAIRYAAQYVPSFKSATVGGPPLHGAQQIPGDDPNRRVGEVCFP